MNGGYGDADEVSFTAMTTTLDFLGSLSSRNEKNNPFYEQAPGTEEDGKDRAPKKMNK